MFKERLVYLININCNGSQKYLSQETNIPTSTISSWLSRGSMPALNQLIILANFFKCTIDYLAQREDELGVISVTESKILNDSQKELLMYFDKCNSRLQSQIIGYAQGIAEKYERININSRIQ